MLPFVNHLRGIKNVGVFHNFDMKGLRTRWMRRYRTFFIIGALILTLQIFLAIRFITGNSNRGSSSTSWSVHESEFLLADDDDGINRSGTSGKRSLANQTALRLDELDFKPSCEIKGKEAVSAIHRAKTQKCKQYIANTTCLSLQGQLYPKWLPNSCPHHGYQTGKSLGCYKDQSDFRILPGYLGVNKKENSPEFCIQLCLQSGFTYAGVQYSSECFCGHDEPPSTSKIADSSCNMKCPGDPHKTCGGLYTMNIFQTGIKRFVPQVARTEDDAVVKSTRIVFLLTVNGRAVRQVRRLIKILYSENHYFYIHVDVRQDYLFRELLPLEEEFPNIKLTRNRFATIWGGASLLTMLLSCMRELLLLDWKWDFVLNLSESDYPVKMVDQLERFLSVNENRNFVKSHGREVQRFIQKQGLDKTFVECDTHMWRVADRQLPKGIQIDGGSDWVALSRSFVAYVTAEEPDELVTGLLIVFKHTLLPAESFFHTVLRNSEFCDTYIDNNLHVTNWKRKLGCKCQYKHVVDWCGCSPNDFRPEDWPKILNTESRQLYFARKFEPIINQAVILQLELWLHGLNATPVIVPNLHSYWQNIYHHLDLSTPVDDGLVTVVNSAARVWTRSLSNSSCAISMNKLFQVTSYHVKDSYKYTLIDMEVETSAGKTLEIELAIKPLNLLVLTRPSTLTSRLELMMVSSEYDQKEQTCRNFARVLSPFSELILLFRFAPSQYALAHNQNVTFLWIDPAGKLADYADVSIDENIVFGYIKPALRAPHLPGAWSVKLVYKASLLAELKFLITPLELVSGEPLTPNQASSIHSGSLATKEWMTGYNQFLGSSFDQDILERLSATNSQKTGKDLQDWIDSLFRKFYTIEKACAVQQESAMCLTELPHCLRTNWSSYAPDPKSAIDRGMLNRTSRSFRIW